MSYSGIEPKVLALLYLSTQLKKEECMWLRSAAEERKLQTPGFPSHRVHQDTPVTLPSFLLGISDRQLIQKDRTKGGSREPKDAKDVGISPAYFWDAAMIQCRLKWVCPHTGCTAKLMHCCVESTVPYSKCCSPT